MMIRHRSRAKAVSASAPCTRCMRIRAFLTVSFFLIVGIGTQPEGFALFKGNITEFVAWTIVVVGSLGFAVRLILWKYRSRKA